MSLPDFMFRPIVTPQGLIFTERTQVMELKMGSGVRLFKLSSKCPHLFWESVEAMAPLMEFYGETQADIPSELSELHPVPDHVLDDLVAICCHALLRHPLDGEEPPSWDEAKELPFEVRLAVIGAQTDLMGREPWLRVLAQTRLEAVKGIEELEADQEARLKEAHRLGADRAREIIAIPRFN